MITGQRVHYRREVTKGYEEGDGIVVAFLLGLTGADGFIEERARIVVQADDGRFLYLAPGSVRVVEEALA